MAQYRVVWEIDIEPDSTANIFDVYGGDCPKEYLCARVDLQKEGNN